MSYGGPGLYWWRRSSVAFCERTGATCQVWQVGRLDSVWYWHVECASCLTQRGESKSEMGARAAVRRVLAKLPDRAPANEVSR